MNISRDYRLQRIERIDTEVNFAEQKTQESNRSTAHNRNHIAIQVE
jgi:hypothetical protein